MYVFYVPISPVFLNTQSVPAIINTTDHQQFQLQQLLCSQFTAFIITESAKLQAQASIYLKFLQITLYTHGFTISSPPSSISSGPPSFRCRCPPIPPWSLLPTSPHQFAAASLTARVPNHNLPHLPVSRQVCRCCWITITKNSVSDHCRRNNNHNRIVLCPSWAQLFPWLPQSTSSTQLWPTYPLQACSFSSSQIDATDIVGHPTAQITTSPSPPSWKIDLAVIACSTIYHCGIVANEDKKNNIFLNKQTYFSCCSHTP